MSQPSQKYCLDANVLIQAWQKYYSPKICPDYWELLRKLGHRGAIFLPKMVFDEIAKAEDELSGWLKGSGIPVYPVEERVTLCVKTIFETDPKHKFLVDSTRQRSLADPWVIAHAMSEKACVVTKEVKETAKTNRIKIPNVCETMGIRCIDDFQFIDELKIKFSCTIGI